ncbi:hypothetical protein HW555_010985 [Spodoptera exigua]|uniref:SWIM-type domain-containing protein n=1 Tax=Spodoptera exigua TaxID=7107 RepID=A0A835G8G1_SPOEX|nr:hypothetical protein HW555_010985 [Spodoptera exigua]
MVTRACEVLLNLNVWHLLLENNNIFSNFTATQIEDIISLAKSELPTFNFERMFAALVNKYHVVIEDSPNSGEIIERVARLMDQPNHLGSFVRANNLNRQRSIFVRVDGDLPPLEEFPIANGVYYIEVCPDLETVYYLGGSRPQILRGRIKSRHIGQRIFMFIYILYETEPINNHLDNILSYYCSCIVGNRTLGCCCHAMYSDLVSRLGETSEHVVISGLIFGSYANNNTH